MPLLSPSTPLVDVAASLDAERATHDDVDQWAIDGSIWGWVSEDNGSPDDTNAPLDRYPAMKQLLDEEAQRIADELARRIEVQGRDRALEWFNSRGWAESDDEES